jgi:O-acetyl-ADP-ribose deacetylase (regulator of RNase III)
MTLIHKDGDIFTTEQPAVIHGVNIVGVMGSGIAKTVRQLYPDVYKGYREYCKMGLLSAGHMLPIYGHSSTEGVASRWVLNAASQDQPGPSATYQWVESSVREAFAFAHDTKLSGVAICRIASAIGGLEWPSVLAIIEKLADEFPKLTVEVWTYKP